MKIQGKVIMTRVGILPILIPVILLLACDVQITEPPLDQAFEPGHGVTESIDPVPSLPPFMPYPDGFQFKNFGGSADWDLFSEIFGGTVHPWSIMDVTYYQDTFSPMFGGGQCYGFAVVAGMFYRNVWGPNPGFFQIEAEIPYEIVQETRGGWGSEDDRDEGIERHISKYWFFWNSKEIRRVRTRRVSAANAAGIIDWVEDEFVSGWEDPIVLEFYGPWGGHAVNIVELERTDQGATLTVYDNNAPFQPGVDSGLREFYWSPTGFTYGSKQIDVIAAAPTAPHEFEHMEKWWGDPRFQDLYVLVSRVLDPEILVLHTNPAGERLGRTSAAQFNQIEGGEEIQIPTGVVNEDWIQPVHYHLPPDAYTVDLINPTAASLAYQLFAGNALLTLEASGPGSASARIENLVEQGGFLLEPQTPLDVQTFRVARALSEEEERALEVSGLALPADGLLQIVPSVDADVFGLVFQGAGEAIIDLTLTEASPSGPLTLPLSGVRLRAGASLQVESWDWARLHEMPAILRTTLLDGSQLLEAGNATAMSLQALLEAMVASGDLPNRGIAVSIRQQAEQAPLWALENHLQSLVADEIISTATAQVLLAVAEAMAGS